MAPAITVQNVKVEDGGKAIVGNVTQHASVIVSTRTRHPRRGRSRRPRAAGDGTIALTPTGSTGMSDHARNTGRMLASPRCGAKRPAPAVRAAGRQGVARSAATCTAAHGDPARRGRTRARASTACFTGDAVAERRQIQALLGDARKLLEEMK
jgi:hypothetical protein